MGQSLVGSWPLWVLATLVGVVAVPACNSDDASGGVGGGGTTSGAANTAATSSGAVPGGATSLGGHGQGGARVDTGGAAGALEVSGAPGDGGASGVGGAQNTSGGGAQNTSGGGGASGGSDPAGACTVCPSRRSLKPLGPGFTCLTTAEVNSTWYGCGTDTACLPPHATPTCSNGACAVGQCDAGFADCDHEASNGCESDLRSPNSCGACGTVCSGTLCTAAGCAAVCPSGTVSCSGSCVDLQTATSHCGICSYACPAHTACSAGSCVAAACSPDVPDPDACGAACQKCDTPILSGVVGTPCVAGKCQIRVGAGWGLASHQLTPYTTPIVLAHNLNTPYDIDVDADNVYWTDTGDGSVWQVGVNGGTPTPLATGLTSPTFMALGDNYVYWMDSTSISRVRKGGGGVQSVVKSQSVLGLSVSGEVVTYIDELTFNRIDGAGGTPTPLGGAVIPSGASPARLAGTLFSTGFFVWTPTGKAAVTGAPVLGRGAWLDDQGGSMYLIVRESLGPTANTREGFGTLYAVPSTLVDISGPYYFSAAGIAWYVDAGPQRLLAVTSKPRHLYATADAVYWTDDRSVLKALTCTE